MSFTKNNFFLNNQKISIFCFLFSLYICGAILPNYFAYCFFHINFIQIFLELLLGIFIFISFFYFLVQSYKNYKTRFLQIEKFINILIILYFIYTSILVIFFSNSLTLLTFQFNASSFLLDIPGTFIKIFLSLFLLLFLILAYLDLTFYITMSLEFFFFISLLG